MSVHHLGISQACATHGRPVKDSLSYCLLLCSNPNLARTYAVRGSTALREGFAMKNLGIPWGVGNLAHSHLICPTA